MRARGITVVGLAGLFAWPLTAAILEDVSPFGTNTAVVWQAQTDHLPKRLWTYKRLPQVFSAAAISNGIVLASFEKKGFPRPSTNDVILWADHWDGEPQPPYFAILPKDGQMSFTLGDRAPDSPQEIARDEVAVRRALQCAVLLGVDPKDLVATNAASVGVYGVFLARQVDGMRFLNCSEGLQVQFGKDGKIRQFTLQWPKLERGESIATASRQEIVDCIRARKTPVALIVDEANYLARIKDLARARTLTIRQIEVCYGEGVYGEEPRGNELSTQVGPFAELEATADFGTNSVSVTLYSPILSSDVRRILRTKGR